MLTRLAEWGADYLIARGAARREDREVYIYGLELTCSTLFSVLSVLLISIIFANVFYAVFYLLCMFIIRLFCGGFHAPTYLQCFLYTNSFFAISLAVALFTPANWMLPLSLAITPVAGLYIFLFSPVENENHPLTEKKILKNRRTSRRLIVTQCLLIVAGLLLFPSLVPYFYIASLSTGVVAILMLVTKHQKHNGEVKT